MTPRRRRLRLRDPLRYERDWWEAGIEWVAGVDEVGRGPLAGPVVAAAVILPPGVRVKSVTDSKLLTPEARLEIDAEVRAVAASVGVGAASAAAIDALGIVGATREALARALGAPRASRTASLLPPAKSRKPASGSRSCRSRKRAPGICAA